MKIKTRVLWLAVASIGLSVSVRAADADGLEMIGNMGKNQSILKEGEEAVLYEYEGEGVMTHFWLGGNYPGLEDTRIRYYIDGETVASIDMNLYMGHGIGFQDNSAPWATKYVGKIGKQNGMYNNYRIPFGKSIKVTAQRPRMDGEKQKGVWWIIRGVKNGRVRLGGVELPKEARLKLHRLENQSFETLEEFNLCDVKGNGALYQVTMAGKSANLNYMEACVRAYLGGSDTPFMLSSGLEDYFLGTYYFDTGKYYADIAGLTHFDKENGEFSAYRFHDEDPVFFQDGFRLTCRVGETKYGTLEGAKFAKPKQTTYTTYAWVYQW